MIMCKAQTEHLGTTVSKMLESYYRAHIPGSGKSIPGTSPQYTLFTVATQPGAAIFRCAFIIRIPAILCPFRHIATHIIEAQPIRVFLFYLMGLFTAVIQVPAKIMTPVSTTIIFMFTAAAACIFPFRLGW